MAELEDFLTEMSREVKLSDDDRHHYASLWPEAERVARDCLSRMPSIGIFSFSRRARAFVAVCQDLDAEITANVLDQEQAQLALTIMRMMSRTYCKAEAMFAARASRLSEEDAARLPETVLVFLSALRHIPNARRR
jgi:hypothetical protein